MPPASLPLRWPPFPRTDKEGHSPASPKAFLLSHFTPGIVAIKSLSLQHVREEAGVDSRREGLVLAELFHNLRRVENPPNLNAKPAS